MRPSDQEIETIRQLHADGHSVSAIAESYHMSRRWLRELVTDVAPPEQVEAVNEERERLAVEAEIASDAASFAGFPGGDQADYVSSLFGHPADGGTAYHDADRNPR